MQIRLHWDPLAGISAGGFKREHPSQTNLAANPALNCAEDEAAYLCLQLWVVGYSRAAPVHWPPSDAPLYMKSAPRHHKQTSKWGDAILCLSKCGKVQSRIPTLFVEFYTAVTNIREMSYGTFELRAPRI